MQHSFAEVTPYAVGWTSKLAKRLSHTDQLSDQGNRDLQ